jgi:hypothetical protein
MQHKPKFQSNMLGGQNVARNLSTPVELVDPSPDPLADKIMNAALLNKGRQKVRRLPIDKKPEQIPGFDADILNKHFSDVLPIAEGKHVIPLVVNWE